MHPDTPFSFNSQGRTHTTISSMAAWNRLDDDDSVRRIIKEVEISVERESMTV